MIIILQGILFIIFSTIIALFYTFNGFSNKKEVDNLKKWVHKAGIRAIKTFCQTALALLPTNAVVEQVNIKIVLLTSLYAAFLSLLTSVAGLPELKQENNKIIEFEEEI